MQPMQVEALHLVLFTNYGELRPATEEEARQTHNATAGNPDGVAAAKALGDLSHLVYVPTGDEWTGEVMFMDQWTSAEGLEQFFADPQVQAGAAALFTSFDPVVWRSAEGFQAYQISAPLNKEPKDRYVAILRGTVTSLDAARTTINDLWRQQVHAAHRQGLDSHEMFVRLIPPGTAEGSAESNEILGVDSWSSSAGQQSFYADPAFRQAMYGLYASQPRSWLLHRPGGHWIEW
jgi:hypothetical protein